MKTLSEQYKNAAPVGVYATCNYGGLVVLDIYDYGDMAVCAFCFGGEYRNIRRHKVYTTYTGRLYIRKGGHRYYFDKIMRTGENA